MRRPTSFLPFFILNPQVSLPRVSIWKGATAFTNGIGAERVEYPNWRGSQYSQFSTRSTYGLGRSQQRSLAAVFAFPHVPKDLKQALQTQRQQTQIRSLVYFDAARCVFPHPSKIERGGEDASFVSPLYLGVADGVGSWMDVGVDPGLYSRELLFHVQEKLGLCGQSDDIRRHHQHLLPHPLAPLGESPSMWTGVSESCAVPLIKQHSERLKVVERENDDTLEAPDPLKVLEYAFEKTQIQGSSTCCILMLNSKRTLLRGFNLGDSGYMVFRPCTKQIIYKSEFQQHDNNFPYQLGLASTDRPSDGVAKEVALEVGDWIVLATDGLWDNVYDEQITEILLNNSASTPLKVSQEIGELALHCSLDDHWDSPFSLKEKEFHTDIALKTLLRKQARFLDPSTPLSNEGLDIPINLPWDEKLQWAIKNGLSPLVARAIRKITGGKPDDLTIVTAKVQKDPDV